jgi:hypothetical protein
MSAAIEQVCTRRFQDDDDDGAFDFTEVQLAMPVEDFLVYRWEWEDLKAFLNGGIKPKLLWITENAFLAVEQSGDMDRQNYIAANMRATSGEELALILVQHRESDKSTAELGVFWRALATSNSVGLTISDQLTDSGEYTINDEFHCEFKVGLPSGPLLSQFLRESPSLKFLQFDGLRFMEEHCRALASLQRTDLEIALHYCKLDVQDAEGAFIEWFRHNQVVTEIHQMENRIFSALSGNNSLKRFKLKFPVAEEEMGSLLQALPGNMGIEDLTMMDVKLTDKNWCLLLHSLSTHPRIESVTYKDYFTSSLSAESRTTWMNAILQMLQRNTVVQTLNLPDEFDNEEVYQNSIRPRLKRNRNYFEVQRQAVKRADPSIRPQLLGRALHVVRYNPNLMFQFLSENVPAFVRTEKEEEEHSASPLHQNEPATIVSGQKRKAP